MTMMETADIAHSLAVTGLVDSFLDVILVYAFSRLRSKREILKRLTTKSNRSRPSPRGRDVCVPRLWMVGSGTPCPTWGMPPSPDTGGKARGESRSRRGMPPWLDTKTEAGEGHAEEAHVGEPPRIIPCGKGKGLRGLEMEGIRV